MSIDNKVKNLKNKIKDKLLDNYPSIATDVISVMTVWSLEKIRWYNINERGRDLFKNIYMKEPPQINYDSPFVKILQSCGNFWDGYAITFGIYYALSVLPLGREKVKIGFSFLTSSAVIIATETGHLFNGAGTHIENDIPAGIAGAGAFIGVHYLGTKLKEIINKQNQSPNDYSDAIDNATIQIENN